MKVWCDTCNDYTLLNERKVCLWCDKKLADKNIAKAKKEAR